MTDINTGSMRPVDPRVEVVIGGESFDPTPIPTIESELPTPSASSLQSIEVAGRRWTVRPVPGPTAAKLIALAARMRKSGNATDDAQAGEVIEIAERVLSRAVIEWSDFYRWADDPANNVDLNVYIAAGVACIQAFTQDQAGKA